MALEYGCFVDPAAGPRPTDSLDRFTHRATRSAGRVLNSRECEMGAERPIIGFETERLETAIEFVVQRLKRLQTFFDADPEHTRWTVRREGSTPAQRDIERRDCHRRCKRGDYG